MENIKILENQLKSLTPLTKEEKINFAKSEWQDQKLTTKK